jgi:hypothetical protein
MKNMLNLVLKWFKGFYETNEGTRNGPKTTPK